MKRTLFLHIGSEKTGTSSLQQFLAKNGNQLNRAGFTYFTENGLFYSKTKKSHSPIAASFFAEPPDFIRPSEHVDNQHLLSRLEQVLLTEERNVILSCEHFSSRLKTRQDIVHPGKNIEKRDVLLEKLKRLKAALNDFKVYVVFYRRAQDELYYALYGTAILNGRREALTDNDVHIYNVFLNHFKLLRPWCQVFGRQNIIVRDYNRLLNNDICDDFLSLLGVSNSAGFKKRSRANTSLASHSAEIIRKLNFYLPRHEDGGYLANYLLIQLRWLVNSLVQLFYHDKRIYELPMKGKIMSKFARSNKALFNTYADHIEPNARDVSHSAK